MVKNACVKKTGEPKVYLKPLPSSLPLQGEKRSSQPSFELSSSEECLVAEKGKEKEIKEEKREN